MERMSKHTGLISSYQLLITAACTNPGYKHRQQDVRQPLKSSWPVPICTKTIAKSGYLFHAVGNVMNSSHAVPENIKTSELSDYATAPYDLVMYIMYMVLRPEVDVYIYGYMDLKLCRLNKPMPSTKQDTTYLLHPSVEKWGELIHNYVFNYLFSQNISAQPARKTRWEYFLYLWRKSSVWEAVQSMCHSWHYVHSRCEWQ